MNPSIALDFIGGSNILDPIITFTRDTTATFTNSVGLIATASINVPRFDYDPVTLAPKGLLIEDRRTNLLFQSAFSSIGTVATNNAWYETSAALDTTVDSSVAPDGTRTAALLAITSATSFAAVVQVPTGVTAGTYAYSVYCKAASTDTVCRLLLSGDAALSNFVRANFTLSGTGSASVVDVSGTAVSAATPTIQAVGDGWYRCTIAGTLSAPTSTRVLVYPGNPGAQATASQTLVWGAQLEAGAFATSYIPTTTTVVTRNADVATITGSNFTSFWNSVQGGTSVQATPSTVSGVRTLVQFDDGTANEVIALRGNTTNPELYIVDGSTPQAQIDAGTIATNTSYSLTGWWATNDCKARQDSGAVVADTTATIPTVTQMRIGSDGTNYLNGTIATIDYYDSFFGRPSYTRRKNKVFVSLL